MKRVLMIAYHFPPLAGSSGIQRTLRFVQHLPASGWQPLVLSASPIAYERTSTDLQADIPPGTVVRRAFALDTARHLSVRGRYIDAMARPDRWVSWRFAAVREGLKMVREFRPDVVWSTYPIATAHLIGAEISRRSGVPWVADFRDPMAQDGYPPDPKTWKQFEAIEAGAAKQARCCVFTTPGAARIHRTRYPEAANRTVVLENGYDEESFAGGETPGSAAAALEPGVTTLLHSGIVYPSERDPTQLFAALRRMKDAPDLATTPLKVRFRAAVHDDLLLALADRYGVRDCIEVCPPVPYKAALREMLQADALLVMQASNCNEQIPAKIYEYLRAGRPIVGLTDPRGDTAGVLRNAGLDTLASLDSADEIAALLRRLVAGELRHAVPSAQTVAEASRARRTAELAAWFERVASGAALQPPPSLQPLRSPT
jgi:glycosyltransferase involved in cell wall biosynthesis